MAMFNSYVTNYQRVSPFVPTMARSPHRALFVKKQPAMSSRKPLSERPWTCIDLKRLLHRLKIRYPRICSVGAGAVADRLGAATLRRCDFRLLLRVVAWSCLTLRRCDVATLRRCEFGRRLRVVASDAATLRLVFASSRSRVCLCRVWRSDAATLRRCEFGRRLRVVASDAATLRLVFASSRKSRLPLSRLTLRRCDAVTLRVWTASSRSRVWRCDVATCVRVFA